MELVRFLHIWNPKLNILLETQPMHTLKDCMLDKLINTLGSKLDACSSQICSPLMHIALFLLIGV